MNTTDRLANTDTMPTDTPVHRTSMDEMPYERMEQHIVMLRARRAEAAAHIARAGSIARNSSEEILTLRLSKHVTAAEKELARIDTLIEKLETRVNTIRTLCIQLGENA